MAADVRRIRGFVVLPPDAPVTTARIAVELRDVTYADGAAPLVTETVAIGVAIEPGARIPFDLAAPESPAGTALGLACQIDRAGDGVLRTGDLVSTQAIPVPPHGSVSDVIIPVRLV
ncbi:hypothetical protein ACFU44_28115 [Nocardia rhizosphaerihabitans]|uniref:hypothetical protein n=1 Tax=Nocardia rhizosphaerihabitans TaxID=1691570 RepID=UPI00366B900D